MATPHCLRHHVGVSGSVPAYIHEAVVAACVRDATFAAMDDPRYTDEVRPPYGGIERPVLILWGEEDRWIPSERGRRLHEAIPGSRLETIPRSSHLSREYATAAAVVEHCKDFFGR
jgi:pimeloyl-ACP methyl ester carboxylesterase